MEEIVYPISLDYVPSWGKWEVVRELVSNAKDTGTNFKMTLSNNRLELTDEGEGLQIRQLLLGVSEKSDKTNAIGQFGEGLKLSLLVLTRLGKRAQIWSGNKYIENGVAEIDGVKVLKVTHQEIDTKNTGTTIIIDDWDEDYTDRFIFHDFDKRIICQNEYGRLLSQRSLFVKGVFCNDLRAYGFGYDAYYVQMNRDRSAVGDWYIRCAAGGIWQKTFEAERWITLFKKIKDDHVEERNMVLYELENPDIVKLAFYAVFGSKAVLPTSYDASLEARHRGASIIEENLFGDHLYRVLNKKCLIKTDSEFVYEKLGEKSFRVKTKDLDDVQKENLKVLKKIAIISGFDPKKIVIAKLEGRHGDCNMSTGVIRIDEGRMGNLQECVSTFLHELAHEKFRTKDLTDEHVNACTDVSAKVILKLMKKA